MVPPIYKIYEGKFDNQILEKMKAIFLPTFLPNESGNQDTFFFLKDSPLLLDAPYKRVLPIHKYAL